MKRNRILLAGIIGALLIVQSTFWEYARMRPDYQFLVKPWSMRGIDMVHGSISVAVGIAVLVSLLLVSNRISERPWVGVVISLAMAATAVLLTALFTDKQLTITFAFMIQAAVFLVTTVVIQRLVTTALGSDRLGGWKTLGVTVGSLLVGVLVAFVALRGYSFAVTAAVGMAVGMIPVLALALSAEPRELIATRMLVMMAFIAILVLGLQAGAIRQTLVDAQAADGFGPAAEYKDTQITSGYFWAQLGALMVFFSSVAMWATRRDHILNVRRARRQREAAEASALEIKEALEAAGLATE